MKTYNFHVLYSDSGSPKLGSFATAEDREKFVKEFLYKHMDNHEDNWIDVLFEGKLTYQHASIKEGGYLS